jgi:predicted Zn-dependent protease
LQFFVFGLQFSDHDLNCKLLTINRKLFQTASDNEVNVKSLILAPVYIRMVDPQTLLLTGLTRDGLFYIENGKIKFPIKNFRFNESPVIMLNNVEALGKPERSISVESYRCYLIPPMKIKEFTFSSLSDAV